jgi:Holliday junction resolvasome RuvABC endonuclease subunit
MRNIVWRVLAIDPTSRGFGFVVLEGQRTLVDWGVKGARSNKKSETLRKVSELIMHYHPRVLVMEDCQASGSRRCKRVRHLLNDIRDLAAKEGLKCRSISSIAVKKVFLAFHAATKHEIARAIGTQLPELAAQLPRYRKPWMSEDYRMAFFDAAAFALAYFYLRQEQSARTRKRHSHENSK